jgi:hypothetical protein
MLLLRPNVQMGAGRDGRVKHLCNAETVIFFHRGGKNPRLLFNVREYRPFLLLCQTYKACTAVMANASIDVGGGGH